MRSSEAPLYFVVYKGSLRKNCNRPILYRNNGIMMSGKTKQKTLQSMVTPSLRSEFQILGGYLGHTDGERNRLKNGQMDGWRDGKRGLMSRTQKSCFYLPNALILPMCLNEKKYCTVLHNSH